MVKSAVWLNRLRGEMRGDALHDHVAAEDHIIHANGNVAGTVPGQVIKLQGTKSHIRVLVSEIHGGGLINKVRKTVDAEDLLARLFRESGLGEEGGKAPPEQRQPGLVVGDGL